MCLIYIVFDRERDRQKESQTNKQREKYVHREIEKDRDRKRDKKDRGKRIIKKYSNALSYFLNNCLKQSMSKKS